MSNSSSNNPDNTVVNGEQTVETFTPPITSADTTMPPRADTSRRSFLKGLASLGTTLAAGALLAGEQTPAKASGGSGIAGSPKPWHASVGIYGGSNNLSTGNTQIVLPVCSWGGLGGGLSFALVFNSQSTRTSSLGAKWTHSFNLFLVPPTGSGPATFVDGDGTETVYTLAGSTYTPPAGCYDTLVHNTGGTWTLTKKSGTKYNFTASGQLSSIVDLNGIPINLSYTSGLLTTVTDAAGRTLSLGYSVGKLSTITDCMSRTYSLVYTSGLPTQLTTPPLSGTSYNQQLTYNSNGDVATLTDRQGRTWSYAYSSTDVLTSATPTQGGSSVAASGSGWPSTVITVVGWQDSAGVTTQYGLDNQNRLVATQDSAGNQTILTYDTSNNVTSRQLPSGNTWNSAFDAWGNETVTQDPYGNQTVRTFNGPTGTLLTSTDANGNQTVYGHDAHWNVTSITDGNSNTTHYTVAGGLIMSKTDATLRTWHYGYDGNGFQNKVTDPSGGITQFVSTTDGNLTNRQDALSRLTNYTLDGWGRTTGVAYPTTGNPSLSYVYDATNNITQTNDGTGLRTYGYNTLGQRTSMTDPRGNTSAAYDNLGRLLTQTDITGRILTNTINTLGQLSSVTDNSGAGGATYTFTVDGQVSTIVYPNNTTVTYGYDNANRVVSLTHTVTSTGSLLVGYTAQYDAGGRLTQITETPSGDVTAFTYDGANNLLTETRTGAQPYSGQYHYDASNRRTSAYVVTNGVVVHNGAYSYDASGRLIQVIDSATSTTETYVWNPDGTLASSPGPIGSGYSLDYLYDEEQHLTAIGHDYGGGTVVTAYQYGYAADGGRRWCKDLLNNLWTWYPCGVACNAGELVEQTSDLTGTTWTTSALYLKSGSGCGANIIRRNSEYHHFDMQGYLSLVSGTGASTLETSLYNHFGVQQFTSGSAQTLWISNGAYKGAEGLVITSCLAISARAVGTTGKCSPSGDPKCTAKYGPLSGYWLPCYQDQFDICAIGCAFDGTEVETCCRKGEVDVLCSCTKPAPPKPIKPPTEPVVPNRPIAIHSS